MAAAVAAGFRGRVSGLAARARRFLAGAVATVAWIAALMAGLTLATPDHSARFGRMISLAAASTVAAIAWTHGRRLADRDAGRRGRRILAAAFAVVAPIAIWCALPRLRCALGSGLGCATAADDARFSRDRASAVVLADRGCVALASGASCVIAGDLRWEAEREVPGGDRDLAAARFQRACELGEDEGCGRERLLGFQRDCEGGRGAACRSLARRTRDDALRSRLYEAACRLGDAEACETVAWAKKGR